MALAAADVSHLARNAEADAQVVEQSADVFPDQFSYNYRTSNGISAQESGALKNAGRVSKTYPHSSQKRFEWIC